MKKILLLIDDLGQGGAERQIIYLAKALNTTKNKVRLVKFFPGTTDYSEMLVGTDIEIETMSAGKNKWKRIWVIRNLIRNWQPDLTIVYKDGTCIAACIAKLFIRYKLAVSERNTTQKINLYENLKFFWFRMADYIIPNSITQSDFICKKYPNLSKKIKTITNMIDIEQFYPSENMVFGKRVIITARLTPQKNVLTFLDALKIANLSSKDVHFDWFGKVHSIQYYSEIKEKVESLGLSNLISFHENGSTNIQEEYRKSTHFCLPSIYEGFPNALCEAMACGLVCCASNICDNQNILCSPEFLFNPFDPYDIAEKLKQSLDLSASKRVAISKDNRKRIVDLCSPQIFTESYMALLS